MLIFINTDIFCLFVQVDAPRFRAGDLARVSDDMTLVYDLQQGHGDWGENTVLVGHATHIGYTTTTKRFSAYTLRGRSPSSVSAKPLSGSGITDLYHSNVVYG